MPLLRRLLVPALCAAALLPGTAAVAATGAPVEVTAAVRTADGRLTFVTERAATRALGLGLAKRMRSRASVVAAGVAIPVRAMAEDPLRAQQWGLTRLAAEQAWAQGPAGGTLVAVVDTGVDATHPDLAAVTVPGLDLIGSGDGRTDPHGHGTHVAGVVAAVGGNGVGGAGLAQGARVLPVRALAADGSGYDSDVARGVTWAVDQGAKVVNLSLGGQAESAVLTAALDYAASRGVVVVAAAGNAGAAGDPVLYPAASRGVIAVGAVGADDVRPAWSSSGSHLALAAPGVGILSTVPGGYSSWDGTSMAAPFVAAAAALLVTDEPALTPADVRSRLMTTARDLGAPGVDPLTGAGMVDVVAARAMSRPAPAVSTAPVASPAATAPSPQPVSEPVSEPVAPAPVVAPAPEPVAPAPVVAPAPPPVEPSPVAVAPAPVSAPAPAQPVAEPRVAQPANVTAVRISRSAAVVLPGRPVVLAARVLSGTVVAAGRPVVLERRVGAGPWTAIRSGTSGSDGLVRWTLMPDRTGSHRVRSAAVVSPELAVAVRQLVTVAARRSGSTVVTDVRVAPSGRTAVALQVLRSTGWATLARTTTTSTGTARFVKAIPRGTRLRVVAAARPQLLAGTSVVRLV